MISISEIAVEKLKEELQKDTAAGKVFRIILKGIG